MTLAQALPYLRQQGGAIRRSGWGRSITSDDVSCTYTLKMQDLLATDWEVAGETFATALDALFHGYSICHIGSGLENSITLRSDTLYAGLGTSKAREYTFTEKDVQAKDWTIEGGVKSGS